jgi:putative tricarboxylic transport membrane protein
MTGMTGNGRRPDGAAFIIAAILAGLGLVLIAEGLRIPDRGGYSGVGPGDVPKLIGGGLVLLALATAWQGLRGTALPPRPRQHPVPLIWLLGGMVVMVATLRLTGFAIGAAIVFTCAAAAMGERRFHIAVPAGLILGIAIYGVFDRLLQLRLPAGPIETLIFGG